MTRRSPVIAAAVAAALFLVTACDKDTPTATPSAVTSVGTPTQQPTGTATATSSPTSGQATTNTTTAPPTGPRIVYFRIKVKPSCPSNGSPVYFPGNPTTLEWEVTGGPTGVSIYLDGGLFSSYPIKDTQEIPFSCEGPSNSQKKHTYTLKTVGGGTVVQQSVVAEAHIN